MASNKRTYLHRAEGESHVPLCRHVSVNGVSASGEVYKPDGRKLTPITITCDVCGMIHNLVIVGK